MLSTAAILSFLLLLPVREHTRSGGTERSRYTVIQLKFEERKEADSPASDTVFYTPGRKLSWDDFRARPSPSGPSAAVTYTSFAYDGNSHLVNDTLRITLRLQVFL